LALEEANSYAEGEEEDALENGDMTSNAVRVLDALTENNDAEPSPVYELRVSGSRHARR